MLKDVSVNLLTQITAMLISNVGIKAKALEPFVINALVMDIFQRQDLISLYNTSDEKDRIYQIKNRLAGLEKASRNLVNEIASGKSKEAIDDLRY